MNSPSCETLQLSEIDSWLTARMGTARTHLGELVSENSFTKNPDGVNRVQDRITVSLECLGLEVCQFSCSDRGKIIQGETKAAKDRGTAVVLVGHADTVHPADSMPHILTERDGKLYGPGAYDMKSGIVVIELALQALQAARILDYLPIRVVVNSAEEEGTLETEEFMSRCAENARAALVFEFGRDGGNIVTSRKGMFSGKVSMTGRAAHAGVNPNAGVNAIEEISKLLTTIPSEVRDPTTETSFNWGTISGGTARNVIAAEAVSEFEVRSNSREGLSKSLMSIERIREYYNGSGIPVINCSPITPPLEETEQSKALAEEYCKAGMKAGLNLRILPRQGGLSDANYIGKSGVPVIDGLGPEGAGAHTKDEYIISKSLYEKALTLIHFLLSQPECARLQW